MNVEIGAEAALFPEKEYINGIAVAVYGARSTVHCSIDYNDFNSLMLSAQKWKIKLILNHIHQNSFPGFLSRCMHNKNTNMTTITTTNFHKIQFGYMDEV
jgi:hypothetical protein